jgi:hypothetical protein
MGCFDVEKPEGGCVIYERCHENCPALCEIVSTDANPNCHEWRWFPDRSRITGTITTTSPRSIISNTSFDASSTTRRLRILANVTREGGSLEVDMGSKEDKVTYHTGNFGADVGQWTAVFLAFAVAALLLLLCCKYSVTLSDCFNRWVDRWQERARRRRAAVAALQQRSIPNHERFQPLNPWTAIPMPDDVPDFSAMRLPPPPPPPQDANEQMKRFWNQQQDEFRRCDDQKREREEKEKRHQQELDLLRRSDEEERRRQEQEEEHRRQQIDQDNAKYLRRLQENFRVLVDTNRRIEQEQERYRQGPQMVVVAPSGTFPPN